jgi:isopenicillin N synthase-like dioxygenase
MTGSSIPLIDFSPFLADEGVLAGQEPTKAQISVAKEIDSVCREHGFLAIKNFGWTTAERDQLFAESAGLFAMPDKEKAKLTRITPSTNTGYAPFRTETLNRSRPAELKEVRKKLGEEGVYFRGIVPY